MEPDSDWTVRTAEASALGTLPSGRGLPRLTVLLRDREDVFGGYSREGFEAAMAQRFIIDEVESLPGSGRVMYRLHRR